MFDDLMNLTKKSKMFFSFLGNVDIFSVVHIVYSFSLFSVVVRFVRCMD